MASAAQMAANRLNAQKGPGGKAAMRWCAFAASVRGAPQHRVPTASGPIPRKIA